MTERDAFALDELLGWVEAELRPWWHDQVGPGTADVLKSVERDVSVFRFSIVDGTVTFHEKTDEQCAAQWLNQQQHDRLKLRGRLYRAFLASVVDAFGITGRAELAIDLDDLADHIPEGPVFSFQKVRGARTILIPDVDLLHTDFYLSPTTSDPVDYADKTDSVIFVGSTTGMIIDREAVEQLAHQRLRSAMFFKHNPEVTYELPGIVQCDGPETEAMIRALELGSVPRSWREQFNHRYLISVDGNGATCSRVAIALKSNGVLMRYDSVHQLYYFHGLLAWKHYVPVADDRDVIDNLGHLRRSPVLSKKIAQSSRAFYRSRLSRIAVMRYMAELIVQYIALFGTASGAQPEPPSPFIIDTFAHVSSQGELRSEPNGWLQSADGNRIEGIGLIPGPDIAMSDLTYRTIDMEGLSSAYAEPWQLSGSRGQSRPIRGFEVRLSGTAAERFLLSYEARFLDGMHSGPTPAGQLCMSHSGAPLTGFRLLVSKR